MSDTGSDTGAGKIACDGCERRYAWRPELAGKRVKCKCGGTVNVPVRGGAASIATPAATPAARSSVPSIASPVAVPVARPVASSGPIAYRSSVPSREDRRFAYDNLTDKRRDVYVPTAVLVVGTGALLAWAVVEAQAGSFGVALFGTFILVSTLVKTAVLIGLAILIAPVAGLSFGGLWSTVLKLAAIVVFADALLMWLETILERNDALPTGRRAGLYVGIAKTMLSAAFIAMQLRFMFDMDSEETGMIAVPLAIVNRVLDFLLWLVLIAALEAMLAPPAAAPAPAPTLVPAAAAATTPGASPAAAGAPVAAPPARPFAAADAAIRRKVSGNAVAEARAWAGGDATRRARGRMVDALYAAGAAKVWIEGDQGDTLYVELPADAAARARVFGTLKPFVESPRRGPVADDDASARRDAGQQFITLMNLRRR